MLFNSLSFICFLAVTVTLYWLFPRHRARMVWLLAASWLFYAAWYPAYFLLLLGVTGANYAGSRWLARRPGPWVLRGFVIANLANLALFKYTGFLLRELVAPLGLVSPETAQFDLFLPLGISFYTFQMIAYLVDVSRQHCDVIKSPLKMALFTSFFPQLIAGPIVRSHEFLPQLSEKRRFDAGEFLGGLDLIFVGMFKKVVVADRLAPFVDQVYQQPEGLGLTTLLATYAYAVQIYCDFSGYTDIGRGCAKCLGYRLPENFHRPYLSLNIIEFWRRWHITLSNWLRDYLYIPLGGSRGSDSSTYRNLLITMALGGLWHGASWNFVLWGLFHGALLAGTRAVHQWRGVPPTEPLVSGALYRVLAVFFTFHLVCLGWVFFRAPTFGAASAVLAEWGTMSLGFGGIGRLSAGLVLAALVFLLGMRLFTVGWARCPERPRQFLTVLMRPFFFATVIVLATLLADHGPAQFIYFQF